MSILKLLFLLILMKSFFLVFTLHSSILDFNGKKDRLQLNSYATYCFQNGDINTSAITLGQIRSKCEEKALHHAPSGYIDKRIWVTIPINVSKSMRKPEKRILVIDSPLLDYIDLYIFEHDNLLKAFKTGDKRPYSSRPVISHNFRFPIEFKPGNRLTLVLNIHSTSGIKLPLFLYNTQSLSQSDSNQYLLFGLFYGILLILALYNLIFFFIFKKPVYLFYVIFVIAYSLMQFSFDGLACRFLWPDNLWLNNYGVPFFVNIAIISAILFGQAFLHSKWNMPSMHRILNAIIIINFILMLLFILGIYELPVRLTALFAILTPMLLIATAILGYRSQPRNVRLYLLAWSVFFIGTIFMAMFKLGYLSPSWWILYSQQIGVIFKVVI